MVRICLLRHGQTAYNAQGNKYCGRTDIEINAKGHAEALRMQELLKDWHFEAVFSSPLKRAHRTAEIVSGSTYHLRTDDRLMEVDFGEWEGKTAAEFSALDPASWSNWLADPSTTRAGRTGETGEEIITRLDSFYQELQENYQGKTVLIVGHNSINRLFLAHCLGMPLRNYRRIVQENSALTLLTIDKHAGFNLLKLNA